MVHDSGVKEQKAVQKVANSSNRELFAQFQKAENGAVDAHKAAEEHAQQLVAEKSATGSACNICSQASRAFGEEAQCLQTCQDLLESLMQ